MESSPEKGVVVAAEQDEVVVDGIAVSSSEEPLGPDEQWNVQENKQQKHIRKYERLVDVDIKQSISNAYKNTMMTSISFTPTSPVPTWFYLHRLQVVLGSLNKNNRSYKYISPTVSQCEPARCSVELGRKCNHQFSVSIRLVPK